MNDPLSMQKHLANSLNATFEDNNVVNLAGNAKIEHPELEGENQNIASLQGQISPKAVIAFDELQKKLQDNGIIILNSAKDILRNSKRFSTKKNRLTVCKLVNMD